MIAVLITISISNTTIVQLLLLFTQSLSYFKTHKFKSVPQVFWHTSVNLHKLVLAYICKSA